MFRQRWAIWFLLLVPLYLASFWNREVGFDDAWFVEQAFFLAHQGVIRSELFTGFLGWDKQIYITQPGHVWLIAQFVKLLGPVPNAAKLPSFFYGLFLLSLAAFYTRRAMGRASVPLSLIVILICGSFINLTFYCRPEILIASLALGSFILLSSTSNTEKAPLSLVVGAGFCAGIIAYFHLNAAIIMTAGGLYLILNRRWRDVCVYSFVALLAASTFVWDALWHQELPVLIQQFRVDPATQGSTSINAKLSNLLKIQEIFFGRAENLIMSLLTLISFIYLSRQKETSSLKLRQYFLCLLSSFLLINNRVSSLYFAIFVPFMALLIVHASTCLSDTKKSSFSQNRKWRYAFGLFFVSHIAFGVFYCGRLIKNNLNTASILEQNDTILSWLPTPAQNIIAPNTFVFGQLGKLHIIGLTKYLVSPVNIFEDAALRKRDYIIFEDHPIFGYYKLPPDTPARVKSFQRIIDRPPYVIYQNMDQTPVPKPDGVETVQ